jgi:hypothetical protein
VDPVILTVFDFAGANPMPLNLEIFQLESVHPFAETCCLAVTSSGMEPSLERAFFAFLRMSTCFRRCQH